MDVIVKTKGIVLGQYDAKVGADALFLVYTKELGKVVVKARGIKKINSKLAGHLATFGIVEFNIAGKNEVRQLTGAVLLRKIGEQTLEDESVRNFVREFIVRAVTNEERDLFLWNLVEQFLLSISLNKKFVQVRLFCYVFVARVLAHLGYFSANMAEKYFSATLNKDFVQRLLTRKDGIKISSIMLDDLGAGLKHLVEAAVEREMKNWI